MCERCFDISPVRLAKKRVLGFEIIFIFCFLIESGRQKGFEEKNLLTASDVTLAESVATVRELVIVFRDSAIWILPEVFHKLISDFKNQHGFIQLKNCGYLGLLLFFTSKI